MPNIKSIITGNNNNLLHTANNPNRDVAERCNCRSPNNFPWDGNCCVSSLVYKTAIAPSDPPKNHNGCCSTLFKTRYGNYKQSFLHPQKKSVTELSKAYWEMKKKEDGRSPDISWSIVRHARPCKSNSRRCFCASKKY